MRIFLMTYQALHGSEIYSVAVRHEKGFEIFICDSDLLMFLK